MTTTPVVLDSREAIEAHLSESIELWERGRRAVRFVLCGPDNDVLVHCPVGELPEVADPDDCAHTVAVFVEALRHVAAPGALLVVLTRPGTAVVTPPDRVWYRAARRICAEAEVRLLGVYLLTPRGLREITLDDAL